MKAIILSFIVSTSSIPTEGQISEVWSAEDVDAYVANHVRISREVVDPFALPPIPPPPASKILLTSSVTMSGADNISLGFKHTAVWKYDPVTETLELKTYPAGDGGTLDLDFKGRAERSGHLRPRIGGLDTHTDRQQEDAGTGQNAYGAKVQMDRVTVVSRGVGELRSSVLETAGPPMPRGQYSYVHTLSITPDAARELTQHLELHIEATTKQWAKDEWVICGSSYHGATVSNPTIYNASGCYLTATLDAFSFVDTRDGSVIKEWRRTSRR